MTSKVRIVTDSTSCIPAEFVAKYGITVIPCGVVIDGVAYRDCIDISLDQICQRFKDMKKQPTTSAINVGSFLDVFNELSKTSDSIICILVTKQLTASQESAYQARRMIRPEKPGLNIEIVDSKTSAGALGFICMQAARAAEEGNDLAGVVRIARDMMSQVVYLSSVETLKYMINMGRIPKGGSSIGEMLNVKPIIGFVDDSGLTDVVARARGKHNALEKIIELMPKYVDAKLPLHAIVHWSDSIKEAEELRDMVAARFKIAEMYITPYSPVMVASTGPMVGVSFYSDNQS